MEDFLETTHITVCTCQCLLVMMMLIYYSCFKQINQKGQARNCFSVGVRVEDENVS